MIDGDEAKGDTSVPSYSNNDDLVFSDNENWDQEVYGFQWLNVKAIV